MSLITTDVQGQVVDSAFVELFELEMPFGPTLYFHSGRNKELGIVKFRNLDNPNIINEYVPLPAMLEGIELSSDGPQNRPTLSIANVASVFKDLLGGYGNEDLIGKRLVRRRTLEKYLFGEPQDSNPPIEFPSVTYVVDRVSAENNLVVEFELASPFDVSGIEIPSRVVVGRFCPWKYKGYHQSATSSACYWESEVEYPNPSGGCTKHNVYYNDRDEPIVPKASITTTYNPATIYNKSDYVESSGTYWVSKQGQNVGNPLVVGIWWKKVRVYEEWQSGVSYSYVSGEPNSSDYALHEGNLYRARITHTSTGTNVPPSIYWTEGDVCGKTLQSCKARFQFKPADPNTSNSLPSVDRDSKNVLPFGGFPGSAKFR